MRLLIAGISMVLVLSACSTPTMSVSEIPMLETTTPEAIEQILTTSTEPVVLNVWASWCVPCRSEAPLLRAAAAQHDGDVRFIGVAVRDTQDGARSFIAEFGLDQLEHYFDPSGAVPSALGGFGVPLTFYFSPGFTLVQVDRGVLDEQSLALGIDELLALRAGSR